MTEGGRPRCELAREVLRRSNRLQPMNVHLALRTGIAAVSMVALSMVAGCSDNGTSSAPESTSEPAVSIATSPTQTVPSSQPSLPSSPQVELGQPTQYKQSGFTFFMAPPVGAHWRALVKSGIAGWNWNPEGSDWVVSLEVFDPPSEATTLDGVGTIWDEWISDEPGLVVSAISTNPNGLQIVEAINIAWPTSDPNPVPIRVATQLSFGLLVCELDFANAGDYITADDYAQIVADARASCESMSG